MEDGLVHPVRWNTCACRYVLILVVMEDGLVPSKFASLQLETDCLNPCCNGRWSRTVATMANVTIEGLES